ncbi:hypothetical protein IQ244_01375 [Nostoc sp. LEGE 06077]|uniref:hypothetical protein n=1 Tax=Nostoc sp. LEGE 06077 TaxID=915325 RepID=UPI00187E5E30|nr:hypothetical protein [Nostoc sp. LEGE 06077]MBE9205205.1 hypothetical protein [Nostoc sp. LEGE 06077]
MFQVWQNWLLKLFFVVTLTITMLVPGNDALASITEQMGILSKIGMQPPVVLALPTSSYLRLKSIKNFSTKPGQVYVNIQETGQTMGPIAIAPGQELPVTLNSCFSNLVTVKFVEATTKYQGQKTVSVANSTITPLQPLDYGSYKMNYEVNLVGCP